MRRVFKYRDVDVEIKEHLSKTYSIIKLSNVEKAFRDVLRLRNLELNNTLSLARKSGFAIMISDVYDEGETLTVELKFFQHEDMDIMDNFMYIFINFIKEQIAVSKYETKQDSEPWSTMKRYEKHFNSLLLTEDEVKDKSKEINFDNDVCGLNYKQIGQSKYKGRKFTFGELSGAEKYFKFEAIKNDFEKLRDVELQKEVRSVLKERFGIVSAFKISKDMNVEIRFIRSTPKFGKIKYYDLFKQMINILTTSEFKTTEVVEFDVFSNVEQYKIILNQR